MEHCPTPNCKNSRSHDAIVCPDCHLLMERSDFKLLTRTRLASRRRYDPDEVAHLKEQYQSYLNVAVRKIAQVRFDHGANA